MSSGKRPKRPRDGRPSSERSGSPPSPKKRTDNPRGTSGSSSKLDVSYLLNDNDNGGTRASTAGHEHSFRAVDVPPPPPLPPPSMAQRASKPSRQGRGGSSSSAPGHSQTRPPPPLPNSQYQSHAVMSSSSPGSSRLPAPPPLPHLHQMQQPQQPLPSYPQPPAARQTHGSGTGGSSNERLHPCSKCDRVFKERGNDGCGKTFSFRDGLVRHMSTVHANERPYQCHICGKQFKQQSHLNKHMRSAVHQNATPPP